MEFFNKKEEVIEVILTQKGKELFSQGKFNPAYYSFHDTDIVYDNGSNEEQNNVITRIKDTPTLKANTSVHHLKTSKKSKQNLYCEIGEKTFGDQYKPAWELNFIESPSFQYVGNRNQPTDKKKFELKLSSSFDNNNVFQETIPQFDIQTVYGIGKTEKDYYLIRDEAVLLSILEYNSFEDNEEQEYELEAYYAKNEDVLETLSFDVNLQNSINKYLSIYFDTLALLKQGNKTKNNYGNLVEKDESNC